VNCSWIISILFFLLQDQVPYKPSEHFELKLDYEFKQRPAENTSTVYMQESNRNSGPSLLPFLAIQLKVLKLQPDEIRLKIFTNDGATVANRKVQEQQLVKFDMGFTADLKDRVLPHEYTLLFLSGDKKEISRIVVFVAADGSFLVNNEQRGKL
jgi:hypothetical protein